MLTTGKQTQHVTSAYIGRARKRARLCNLNKQKTKQQRYTGKKNINRTHIYVTCNKRRLHTNADGTNSIGETQRLHIQATTADINTTDTTSNYE